MVVRYCIERFIALLLLPPVLLIGIVLCMLIRMDSPGPVLFRQRRPGVGSRTFVMLKLRTMYAEDCGTGSPTTYWNDKRVTRAGRWLRKFHLDELPQVWNVLRGEMSFIGPRPEPMEENQLHQAMIAGFRLRRVLLPGITGWAQVRLGYTTDVEGSRKKFEYDLYYIRNASLVLDARIVLETLKGLFVQRT